MKNTKLNNLKMSARFLTSALDSITEAMTNEDDSRDLIQEAQQRLGMSIGALNKARSREPAKLTMWNFIEQFCDVSMKHSVAYENLYECFQTWCSDNDVNPGNQASFHRNLLTIIPNLRRVGGYGEYRFQGIGLKGG